MLTPVISRLIQFFVMAGFAGVLIFSLRFHVAWSRNLGVDVLPWQVTSTYRYFRRKLREWKESRTQIDAFELERLRRAR